MVVQAVVILKRSDLHCPTGRGVVVGEVPGPWPSVEAAVKDTLLDEQTYRPEPVDGILYAEEV